MNIRITQQDLEEQVALLKEVVNALDLVNDDLTMAAGENFGNWSQLSTVSRVSSPLYRATRDVAAGVNALLLSTDDTRRALVRAAEELGDVDQSLMNDLEAIADTIEDARPVPPGVGGGMMPYVV